jgi:hypothetical protein
MCNDNVDLGDFVLSQCGSIVAFAQRMRKSREPVADRLFTGNIALTKEMHEVQRQRGHLVIQTPSFSVNGTRTLGTADGINWGQTKAQSRSDGTSTGKVKNWADVENEGEAVGGGQSSNEGDVTAAGSGWSYHPIIVNGMIVGNAPTFSTNNNGSASRQRGQNSMQTFQKGRSHMDGGGRTENVSHIKGHSISRMQGGSHTENASNSSGWGLSLNTSLVPNMVSEYEWTGRYIEGSASDQREMHQRWLHVLNTAECFMSVLGCPFAFPVKIDHVDELWSSPTLKWHATQIITRKIAAQHAYTFSPADVPCPGTCQHGAAAPREFEADEENPIA